MKPGSATVTVVTVCLLSGVGCRQSTPRSSPAASEALAACTSSMKALGFSVSRTTRLGLLTAAVSSA